MDWFQELKWKPIFIHQVDWCCPGSAGKIGISPSPRMIPEKWHDSSCASPRPSAAAIPRGPARAAGAGGDVNGTCAATKDQEWMAKVSKKDQGVTCFWAKLRRWLALNHESNCLCRKWYEIIGELQWSSKMCYIDNNMSFEKTEILHSLSDQSI